MDAMKLRIRGAEAADEVGRQQWMDFTDRSELNGKLQLVESEVDHDDDYSIFALEMVDLHHSDWTAKKPLGDAVAPHARELYELAVPWPCDDDKPNTALNLVSPQLRFIKHMTDDKKTSKFISMYLSKSLFFTMKSGRAGEPLILALWVVFHSVHAESWGSRRIIRRGHEKDFQI